MPSKGQKFRFFIDGNKVGETREKELNRSKNLLDKSSDDRPDDATYVGALREGEVTISGLYAPSDTGQSQIEAAFEADGATPMELKGESSGDQKVEFDGHIEDWTRTHNLNELSVFELTIRTEGDITEGTVA